MKLVSAVSHAGGQVNEDAWGMVGNNEDVEAAWVLDGVTGINTHNYLPGQTDAAWFVKHAHTHLLRLTAENHSLDTKCKVQICRFLVPICGEPTFCCDLPSNGNHICGSFAAQLTDGALRN